MPKPGPIDLSRVADLGRLYEQAGVASRTRTFGVTAQAAMLGGAGSLAVHDDGTWAGTFRLGRVDMTGSGRDADDLARWLRDVLDAVRGSEGGWL